jgi:hypothetical protein
VAYNRASATERNWIERLATLFRDLLCDDRLFAKFSRIYILRTVHLCTMQY